MKKCWIVTANRAGARIFEREGKLGEVKLLKEIVHESGKLRNQDLVSDKPGRSLGSFTDRRSSFSPEHDAQETETIGFARELAREIESAAYDDQFEWLVLAAEPGMLGFLKPELGHHSNRKLVQALDKDLSQVGASELAARLD